MLEHLNVEPKLASRTVVLGAGGFVGGAITRRLRAAGAETVGLSRPDLDLQAPGAGEQLAGLLRESDALVCVAAIAPVKNIGMLKDNLTIIETIRTAIAAQPVSHIVNIGSDAIYADSREPLGESSSASPGSLHGIMHLTREVILAEAAGETPFTTLRPTLIYGIDDPHNGYGPNRFRRLAAQGAEIVLFGEGEEQRDHVWVEDVADLALRILSHRSRGVLNAATGSLISFREAAERVISHFGQTVAIKASPRSGPMPHDGYRPFDPTATYEAFPEFRYTPPDAGFAKVHAQLAGAD
ncbi:MAG: NAD-dependent epimerase/dehydratase family protein [bacterium]|nr:NAD-dependent epimerase/dehydratase family protein [bacterium]